MSKEELKHVHGYDIPAKGEKVTFLNLGKLCTATGNGEHSCYQLIGHHPGGPKKKSASKPKPPKKTAAKKPATKKKSTKKK